MCSTAYELEVKSTTAPHSTRTRLETDGRTWATITKLHIASIPCFPRTSRRSWPIGSASSVFKSSETEVVVKEMAMMRIQPIPPTAATEVSIAIGAARAAPDTSSEICAAESSTSTPVIIQKRRGVPVVTHILLGTTWVRRTTRETPSRLSSSSAGCLSIGELSLNALSFHPVLFSNEVKATFVDTLLSPEQTRSAMVVAIVTPAGCD